MYPPLVVDLSPEEFLDPAHTSVEHGLELLPLVVPGCGCPVPARLPAL